MNFPNSPKNFTADEQLITLIVTDKAIAEVARISARLPGSIRVYSGLILFSTSSD